MNGVTYKKDLSGQWVELAGVDEDLHALQVLLSIAGSPVEYIEYGDVTNTQAPETMHNVQADHFIWYSGDTKIEIWVDSKTGYAHKLSSCGPSSVGEFCMISTQSNPDVPVDILKLAGGVVPAPVSPTATIWD